MVGLPCMGNSIRSWGRGESGGPRPLARGPQELVSLNEREHPVPLKCINDHGGRQPAQEGVTSRRHQSDDEDASVVAASTQSAKAQAAHSDDAGLWRDDAIVGRPPDRVARHHKDGLRQLPDGEQSGNIAQDHLHAARGQDGSGAAHGDQSGGALKLEGNGTAVAQGPRELAEALCLGVELDLHHLAAIPLLDGGWRRVLGGELSGEEGVHAL